MFSNKNMDTKIKRLLPTQREKKRYIVFEVISQDKISDFVPISQAIKQSITKFLGEFLTAKAGIKILPKLWTTDKRRGVLKVNNTHTDLTKSALTLIKTVGQTPVIFRNIGVTGTIKKAHSRYLT